MQPSKQPLPAQPSEPSAARSLETVAATSIQNLNSPDLYFNRELSLLQFQKRVLQEGQDPANPLLERVKFLSILGSNIDEFFMVRVAGLLKQVASGSTEVGIDGRSAMVQLAMIRQEVRRLSEEAQAFFRDDLLPALECEGIRVRDYSSLNREERAAANEYFQKNVFPVLTPLAFDPSRPFPHISSRSLNLAVVVADSQGIEHFARVKVPDTLAQLVPLVPLTQPIDSPGSPRREVSFVWLEQLIAANLELLFSGLEIVESHPFRVTRDAEVPIQELESGDLLETVEEALRQRRFASAVRLQVGVNMPDKILDVLTVNLALDPQDVYRINGPIGLTRLIELHSLDRPDLKDKPLIPHIPANLAAGDEDIFARIRKEDVLLHHPFESFQPVVDFLNKAAHDPDVLAIKMTLYRVGRNSPIVAALLEAIENGKQVAVLLELKARFDEESNIEWARMLEDAGVHVVYGMVGFKVHSKIALIVRREGSLIRRYVHLGTGNYNPMTARVYTDFGLLTCNDDIAEDTTHFFNALTGYSSYKRQYRKLLVAPINLRQRLEELILREVALQQAGNEGRVILKMNALEDPQMIQLLYRASQAGVKIDLLVRGLCSLRPGIPGVSENIRVTSIVGRFLEHSRVFYFRNGGAEEVYLGSADLMRRNLNHRIEIAFPIENPKLVRRLSNTLSIYLQDEAKARHLQSDGTYVRANAKTPFRDSQLWLMSHQEDLLKIAKRPLSLGPRRPAKNGTSDLHGRT
ncbi:MAG: polyphosphate kinase 1 [Acidobacteria bacterium]|nr:polyphosphate kinase 1 [Acidobacteriota bacterium]